MNVSVLIGTYGDPAWLDLADRALASTAGLGAYEVLHSHHEQGTLASVRNSLAASASGDWLCFLDADDELAPGYLYAMEAARDRLDQVMEPERAMFAPAVQYVTASGARYPARIPTKHHCGGDIRRGSWLVIGTLVPRHMFHGVGGFREYPLYEDWALFAACWQAGCQIVEVPSAVYVAHMRKGSRNRGNDRQARLDAHRQITADLFPELVTPA